MRRLVCVGAAVVLGLVLTAGFAFAEKEVKVSLDKVPAKVKEAIQKQVQGGEIKEIERKGEGEKAVYEIEYLKDGKKAELCLTPEGAAAKNEEDDDHKGK